MLSESCSSGAGIRRGGHLGVQAVAAVRDGHGGQAPDPAGMPHRDLQRHAGPQAVSDQIGPGQAEMVEQRGDVVGEQLVPQRPADVAGVPVTLQLDGDDAPARGEPRRVVVQQVRRHERPVDQHQGRAGALRLVVELELAEPGEGPGRGRVHGAGVSFR